MSDIPDEIWADNNFRGRYGGWLNEEVRGTEKYHHDRVVQALQAENKRLRENNDQLIKAIQNASIGAGAGELANSIRDKNDVFKIIDGTLEQALKESGGS